MKFFEINLENVPSDANPEDVVALKAFIEDVYNRGANAGFYVGFVFAASIAFGGLTAHLVTKHIEKRKANRNHEQEVIE